MFTLMLLAAQGGGQVAQIAQTFGVDWRHLAAQTVSFGIVCAILYKFAYRNVLTVLEERRQQIAQGIANAEKIKAELDKTEAQRQEVLARAYQESAKVIQEARQAADRLLKQEIQKAIQSAEQIVIKAHEAAAQDRDRMAVELKREVGHWVVEATAALMGKVLTADDQRRLAEETAKQVAA